MAMARPASRRMSNVIVVQLLTPNMYFKLSNSGIDLTRCLRLSDQFVLDRFDCQSGGRVTVLNRLDRRIRKRFSIGRVRANRKTLLLLLPLSLPFPIP